MYDFYARVVKTNQNSDTIIFRFSRVKIRFLFHLFTSRKSLYVCYNLKHCVFKNQNPLSKSCRQNRLRINSQHPQPPFAIERAPWQAGLSNTVSA